MFIKFNFRNLSFVTASILVTGLATVFSGSVEAVSPSGYYRVSDRPEVYFLNSSSNTYCHVQNPSQMNLLGGFGKVRVVGGNSFRSGATNVGECDWPKGFYRRKSRPEVYRLSNTQMCWVSSPEMMEAYGGFGQVRVVENSSDIKAGRTDVGECDWPR